MIVIGADSRARVGTPSADVGTANVGAGAANACTLTGINHGQFETAGRVDECIQDARPATTSRDREIRNGGVVASGKVTTTSASVP